MSAEVLEIIQDRGKGKILYARLVNDRELRVENALNRNTLEYRIDVIALKGESQRKIILGWQWLLAGLVVILVSFLIPAVVSSALAESFARYLVYLVGAIVGVTCFYFAWQATAIKQVFYSRNANVPLVEFFLGKPSKDEFVRFIGKLELSAMDAQQKMDLSLKNQLAGEMKMLRRLSEQGVLSASNYKKAKAELLSKH